MAEIIHQQLDCGMTLVVEPIASVESVALNWLLPGGSACDPPERDGESAMFSELIFRGAGGMTSREHSDALDRVGVRRDSGVNVHHLQVGATLLGTRLDEALPLLTMLVRSPALADESIDPVRSLCLQSIASLDDDPQHLVMLRLRELHLTPPFNRHGYGTPEALATMTGDELRTDWLARCRPQGAIFAAAGAVDSDRLANALDAQLAGWTGKTSQPDPTGKPARGTLHIPQDTAQVHIGAAFDAPPEPHRDSMLERLAITVLSGSTSGRLFTEVRQKRALCYSVGASYRAGRDHGYVTMYAGTTPQRAQETLDVAIGEIERMREGVDPEEFHRAVTGLKSHLIMQGESTPARASALGSDLFRLGRPRTLDEIAAAVDAITLDALNAYLAARDFGAFTLVTIGPNPVEMPALTFSRTGGLM